MTVSFDYVPQALRYPGVYIEIDGSQAGLGTDIPAVLLVGQKLAAGSAVPGEITRISSVFDAQQKAGVGSMLAQMAARYRAVDTNFDLYMLPYADNPAGVAATGTITATAAATADGTLALYIAGKLVSVGITSTMTTAQIATAIAAAFTDADIPVTAAAVASVVTLTARHKGTCGNNIDMRLNLYGELKPTGLGLTLAAMSGGSGDPAPGNLPTLLGVNRRYRYVALGINDAATLAAWFTESQRRYQPPVQAGFRLFTTHRGDFATASAFGETKNYEHFADVSLELNPTSTWEAAAIITAAAAPRMWNNPVESLEGTPLPGMIGVTYHEWTNSNSLLFKGMSVIEVGTDGSCYIKRLISMHQYNPDGSPDDGYLDINMAEVADRTREEQIKAAKKAFVGTAAAENNEGYKPGLRITTVDSVTALLLSLYQNRLMRELGWVQKYKYYKETLYVEQDPDNPSRFNFVDHPVYLVPFYILAGRSQFLKRV
ncbi:phage tail protein [Methylomonas fluvii]|uniref:Phage tail protein n=1 Tax=Methylomonas fluvii TaxID=1854564 RepID=A0ABR9DIH9_9GAMM|nr:phage tail protein [Methylomonas fluvii]MBD9362909.1 phage tail protein [Methylomonas fluvii]